ncbi:MAG: hypothetical protein IPJ82_05460 [Lewinellaceae bacterium]|nr:hypothetical protein [Lewinellaceae bacterium]
MNAKITRHTLYTQIIGHATFAALSVMAIWFWQERTLILDAAFQSYLFIATGEPAIMVERYGAAAVQLLPLAAVWAGASLQWVLILYSLSIVLFHWALFSICLHGFKDKKAALAILLFNVLLVGDCFYWMQNELLQAVSLLFVMWSWWLRKGDWANFKLRDWVISVALAATVIYYHPLVFFPLGFMWCWFWFVDPPSPSATAGKMTKKSLVFAAVLFALIFCSKYIFRQPNFYDRGMTGQYVREFHFSVGRLLQSQSLRDFLNHLDDNFLFFLPLWGLVTGFYLWKKEYWPAALVFCAPVFYILLIMQRFLNDDRWYIQESHYQALAVFLIVPLVLDVARTSVRVFTPRTSVFTPRTSVRVFTPRTSIRVFTPRTSIRVFTPRTEVRATVAATLLILLVFRLAGIWNTHHAYTARLAYVRNLMVQTAVSENRKLVIGESQADRKKLLMYWGLPFETLQLSALESPDSLRVIAIAENPDSVAAALPRDSMVTFLMIPPRAFRDLPARYYRMADTLPYRAVSY